MRPGSPPQSALRAGRARGECSTTGPRRGGAGSRMMSSGRCPVQVLSVVVVVILLAERGSCLFDSPGPKQQSPLDESLDCPAGFESGSVPRCVHRLRPGDIRVVGAMGDSITAGNGALSVRITDVITNYRGVSWSAGGRGHYSQVFTLPNVLKSFSPRLIGYSTGSGDQNQPTASFNVAVPGSVHQDIPGQAWDLVKRIRQHPDVDFFGDWKLVTLMVGGNNLCSGVCKKQSSFIHSPLGHAHFVRQALDILHENLPRTFVNLIPVVDVTALLDVRRKNLPCKLAESHLCPCLFGRKRWKRRQMQHWVSYYQTALKRLVRSGRYDTHGDFTVVLQPFNIESQLPMQRGRGVPQADPTFLSADCFHLSQRGHALMAQALWNNMLEPIGHKSLSWQTMHGSLRCPTERNPFFTTWRNPSGSVLGTCPATYDS